MKETDYLSETRLRHFRMIDEYLLMMSMPHAEQKAVLNTLLAKYGQYYKNFDSIKQTFARLKRDFPDRFEQKESLNT